MTLLVNPDIASEVNLIDEVSPIRLWPKSSSSELGVVVRAVYRQVLGNAHVMESERLEAAESQLRQGAISVREFVRLVAQSDLYRTLFFESCPRIRSIELNFKHLLGRAPEHQSEIAVHSGFLDQGGFEAEINSYLDSEEYLAAFGEDTVPFYRGNTTQVGQSMVGFTHMTKLLRGTASSDKDRVYHNRSWLTGALMANQPSTITPVQGAPTPWQHPQAPTDFGNLITKVLGIKTGPPTQVSRDSFLLSEDRKRQEQFYQAYQSFKETDPVKLYPGSSTAEADVVIRALYRQVLGNAYVMESERLIGLESQLKQGNITVREFVRQLAKSELYRSRFFDSCARYRSVELNFKHLLGRAPDNFEEMRFHSHILDVEGFEADIDSYLDSDEYQTAFGENIVPYYRGYQTHPGQSMLEFTNMLQLVQGGSSSDRQLTTPNQPRLTRAIIRNSPYGKLKVRDVSEILAEVFKPKPVVVGSSQPTQESFADQTLRQTIASQQQEIERLQHQLADLRPFAAIGAAQLKNYGEAASEVIAQGVDPMMSLSQQVEVQIKHISTLQGQVAEARRYATIGESRLNKWRSRVFRS